MGARAAFVGLATIATGLVVGIGLGWLSWLVMVIGLFALVTGLAVGIVLAAMLVATGRLDARWSPRVIAVLAVLVAWSAMQVIEDRHLTEGVVRAEAARRWRTTEELRAVYQDADDPGLVQLVRAPTEAHLHDDIFSATGGDDLLHRWWYRAQAGVRLAGPWAGSRGLPIGPWGASIWALADNILAVLLALTIVRRLRRRMLPVRP